MGSPWGICVSPGSPQYLFSGDGTTGKIYKMDLSGKVLGWAQTSLGHGEDDTGRLVHEISCAVRERPLPGLCRPVERAEGHDRVELVTKGSSKLWLEPSQTFAAHCTVRRRVIKFERNSSKANRSSKTRGSGGPCCSRASTFSRDADCFAEPLLEWLRWLWVPTPKLRNYRQSLPTSCLF